MTTQPDSFYEQKLSDFGFAVNDIVVFDNSKLNPACSSGGVIYKIISDTPPKKIETSQKIVTRQSNVRSYKRTYVIPAKDKDGKKVSVAESKGCIRCIPIFEFFASSRGKKPGGVGKTLTVIYKNLKYMKKISIVEIGTKYVELGNFLISTAKDAGT
jgi:hypothetical protein